MANVASARKRMRSNERKRLQNRYQKKTVKTAMKQVLKSTEKSDALLAKLNVVYGMLDKLVKRRIFHRNTSARKKSILGRHVNGLKG